MKNSILLKVWMSLTGLFLALFLVVHLLGNLQLFLPTQTARAWFNAYSEVLAASPIISVAAVITYVCITGHVVVSGLLTLRNRAARGYVREDAGASSPWYSRWMGALGLVLLVFLIVHMLEFWYPFQYGTVALDPEGHRDLYGIVARSFASPWVVLGYVASMVALGFHLQHGYKAAVRSLGGYGHNLGRAVDRAAPLVAWTIAGLFAAMPVFVFWRGPR